MECMQSGKVCDHCKKINYSIRLVGCTYCHYAQPRPHFYTQVTCNVCSDGIQKWLKSHVVLPKETPAHAADFAFDLQCDVFTPWLESTPACVNGWYSPGDSWKGFYAGGNKWVIPDTKIVIDKVYPTRPQVIDAVIAKCKEHGIFLRETIQYNSMFM